MGEVPGPALARWKVPDRGFWTRLAQIVLIVAMVICLAFIYFLGMQLRYESEGAKLVKEQRYALAAEKYLLAHDEARLWGRDRYLHLVSWCYKQAGDPVRAMDFAIRLAREHQGSSWTEANLALVVNILEKFDPDNWIKDVRANTQLGQARAKLRESYTRMVGALKSNKSGVSVELEGEYIKYKKYWEIYKRELVKSHKAVKEGVDPEKVDVER